MPFRPMPAQVDLPALEREVLARWRDRDVFHRSLAATAGGPLWTFYEGPPTANGKPGTHHVEARVFKDLFPRFKTMKGFHVPRRAGWDCHGLPVELEVEKRLGFTRGKQQIEDYGIAEFNARCRESVQEHVGEFSRLTERMGYWVDLDDAYWTMNPAYVESVWWSLQQIFDRGLLVQDHRVTPYCPRCGTGLSDHEVAQGYYEVSDPSVFVRFPVLDGPLAELHAALLVWTTTPWTLISNTAVAVHPDVTYVAVRVGEGDGGEVLVVAEPLLTKVFAETPVQVLAQMAGRELEHTRYQRPFDLVDIPDAHYVGVADYVTVEDGTGLVHQAPAFGADDLAVARRYGMPVVNPVKPDGHFVDELPLVGGQFFKSADPGIVEDLRARGLLLRSEAYVHSYPHCWRCDTALIYYALPSWYIRTTVRKDALLRENERTTWYPETIKHGRYGDWLNNNVDWALSRNRYWGTPLPIWRCDNDHLTCVGSLAELSSYAGRDLTDLDPHRPFIDDVTFACKQCGETATRVPEVIDCWYDAGSMPFAQWGAPHRNLAEFEQAYPAQFICEAIDQTRGWFYTLMAIGTLVFDRSSYETVVCLGHILDEQGRKMSKHLGNVLDPFELFEKHGADALRWFMLCGGSPWSARRVGDKALEEVVRKVLLTYWNTAAFLVLYANANNWTPPTQPPPVAERPLLDRWVIGELHRLVGEVDDALEDFDSARAGRALATYVDELSNWYVRRSRRRFWDGDPAALATLHACLDVVTRLLAPFVPFLTEEVHERLMRDVDDAAVDSVHLCAWPAPDAALIDDTLSRQMSVARRVVELGRAARAEAKVKNRQPLAALAVFGAEWQTLDGELRRLVLDELNVADAVELNAVSNVVHVQVKPNFRTLGKRFGPRTKDVAAALVATAADDVVAAVRSGAPLTLAGEEVALSGDDVIVTESPAEGWATASEPGLTVALDLRLTDELRRAGTVREVIRLVQEARKAQGFDVSDRIELWWASDETQTRQALEEGTTTLADEVLAVCVTEGRPAAPLAEHRADDLALTFWLRVVD